MKQHDLKPDLRITLSDDDGLADFNNTATSTAADYRIIGRQGGVVIIDGQPGTVDVDSEDDSVVVLTREWEAGDTDEWGEILFEVEVMWPGGRPQTFPDGGYQTVRIVPDLA